MKIELGQVQKMLEWLKTKLYLDSIAQNARSRTVKRGQVYCCNFGCGIGSEMQKNDLLLLFKMMLLTLTPVTPS
ncbi:MAG: hypothetical protein Q4C84_01640 [Bacillota bacterium]|nr:hypothetical protein [Bacillota bacterium]